MATSNRATVVPYPFVLPLPAPITSLPEEDIGNDYDQRRNEAWPLSTYCTRLSSFLGGLALVILLTVSIVLPLIITLATSITEMSSTTSVTNITTTLNANTTTSIFTTTTTAIPCLPTCNSQETCVKGVCVGIGYLSCTMTWSRPGDGDIVVRTPTGNTIAYNNTGPSQYTDQGQLDKDDRNGTGPENVFWSNSRSIPPTGIYYVCFEPYFFNPSITSINPISVTIKVMCSNNNPLIVIRNFTSTIKNGYDCQASSKTLLISFTYP